MIPLKQALKIIGGLSSPSKMPCHGYSIPTHTCLVGMKMHKVKNSVCSKCYAMRGNYRFDVVQNAQNRRFKSLKNPKWTEAMTSAIFNLESLGFFRWHDSGDLQGTWHLKNICKIAQNLPDIKFWLPTREYGIVSDYIKENKIPDNLTIRLSALMLNGEPPKAIAERLNLTTSNIAKENYTCPASLQGNKCLRCRNCWNKNVSNVVYKYH